MQPCGRSHACDTLVVGVVGAQMFVVVLDVVVVVMVLVTVVVDVVNSY